MPKDRQLEGVSVLVVEDSPDAREVIAEALRKYGANVVTAESAHSALRILEKTRPDVLLSDIALPLMDGFALLRRVRELEQRRKLPPIPAAAVTAFTSAEYVRECQLAGFQFHLGKPFVVEELIATVARLAGTTDESPAGTQPVSLAAAKSRQE